MAIKILNRTAWGGTEDVSISADDRRSHTYIVGKTGSGKSTLLRNILVQEIESGQGVGLIDPHGDLAGEILDLIPVRRINDVVYFNPGDAERPCGLNVLRTPFPPDLIGSSVVSALKNIWRDSWGPRLEHILYASITSLAHCENVSLLSVPRLLMDDVYRAWVVRQVADPVLRSFWNTEFAAYDRRFRNEAIAPVLNKVGQFLLSPTLRNILGQVKNRIDFGEVLDRRQIFIANLAKARIGEEKSKLLGSLLVSQFELAGMDRAKRAIADRSEFGLFVDEFQNFGTESLCTILSEARKYGLHLTLSHQYVDQLRPEIRNAVLGNVASLICFRVGAVDAEILSREFSATFAPSHLTGLAKYEVAARLLLNGQFCEPFFASTLSPMGKEYGAGSKIYQRSSERFTVNREMVEAKIKRWLGELEF